MEPQNFHPDRPPSGESPLAQRILQIDAELDALRRKRPTLFGVVFRVLTGGGLLMVALELLVSDSSETFLAVALLFLVIVWAAHFGLPILENFQRERLLGRELDALIAEPNDRLEVSDGGV